MPLLAPIKDAKEPYDYDKAIEWMQSHGLLGEHAAKEDLSAAMKLLLPQSPAQSVEQTALPGYLVSAHPVGKSLYINTFESEGQRDLVKFVKDIVAQSKKHGYETVQADPMLRNPQGGRAMADLMGNIPGAKQGDIGDVEVSVAALEKLLTDPAKRKEWLTQMKSVPKSRESMMYGGSRWTQPGQQETFFTWGPPSRRAEHRDLGKVLEREKNIERDIFGDEIEPHAGMSTDELLAELTRQRDSWANPTPEEITRQITQGEEGWTHHVIGDPTHFADYLDNVARRAGRPGRPGAQPELDLAVQRLREFAEDVGRTPEEMLADLDQRAGLSVRGRNTMAHRLREGASQQGQQGPPVGRTVEQAQSPGLQMSPQLRQAIDLLSNRGVERDAAIEQRLNQFRTDRGIASERQQAAAREAAAQSTGGAASQGPHRYRPSPGVSPHTEARQGIGMSPVPDRTLHLLNQIDDLVATSRPNNQHIRSMVYDIFRSNPSWETLGYDQIFPDLIDRVSSQSARAIRDAFREIDYNVPRQVD